MLHWGACYAYSTSPSGCATAGLSQNYKPHPLGALTPGLVPLPHLLSAEELCGMKYLLLPVWDPHKAFSLEIRIRSNARAACWPSPHRHLCRLPTFSRHRHTLEVHPRLEILVLGGEPVSPGHHPSTAPGRLPAIPSEGLSQPGR